MKVVILNTHDKSGGAARAAYRLHKGLGLLNQSSLMAVLHKESEDPSVKRVIPKHGLYSVEKQVFRALQRELVNENRSTRSNTLFSIPYPGYDISKSSLIMKADVVNLHWINRFQSIETISNLLELGKPVVWTLHDQWPFTGGCHYSAGCEGFMAGCEACPQLREDTYGITTKILNKKIKEIGKPNLTIVTPSRWLAERARRSRVFTGMRVEVIPNSVETDIFKPEDKGLAKAALGIGGDAFVLLSCATSYDEKRKGFDHLLEAMSFCLQDSRFRDIAQERRVVIATFGRMSSEIKKLGVHVTSFGYIYSDEKLAKIYSAADVCLLPSEEDNLPNNMIESMSCGTPVVSFNIGGIPEVIEHGITGYLAPAFDSEKFAEHILTILFDESKRRQMGLNCRQLVKRKYGLETQAVKYLDLFRDLLSVGKPDDNEHRYSHSNGGCEEIILQGWNSELQDDWHGLFRKSALKIMAEKDDKIRARDRNIERIYKGYTYRCGDVLLRPLKWFARMMDNRNK